MLQAAIDTRTTTLSDFVRDYALYNLWANRTMVAWLRTQDAALLEKEAVSSFTTIKTTLKHMWATEAWWVKNLRGENPSLTFGQVECRESAAEVMDGLIAQSEELLELVESLTPEQLQQTYRVSIPFTGDFEVPGYRMVPQITNHTTYHRGQVVTIGRNLGITDAPMTDYMYYLLVG